jgi:hypothetical protein
MALVKPYCTVADVKSYTRDNDITHLCDDAINHASRFVDQHCRRSFWFQDYTSSAFIVDYRDITPDIIYLPWPIINLTEVKQEDSVLETDSYTGMSDGRIRLRKNSLSPWRIISRNTYQFNDELDIAIKGTFGYTITSNDQPPTDPNFPTAIRRATTIIAATLTDENEEMDPFGEGTPIPVRSIPEEAFTLLKEYRRSAI